MYCHHYSQKFWLWNLDWSSLYIRNHPIRWDHGISDSCEECYGQLFWANIYMILLLMEIAVSLITHKIISFVSIKDDCELYHCVLESKSFLEKMTVLEHTIPFFLPIREAENDLLSSNAMVRLVAYVGFAVFILRW